jgi:phosphoglycerate-specific signal transduction histidine kinase
MSNTFSSNAQLLRELKRREKELNQVRDLLRAKEEIIELLRFKIERLEHEK